MFVMPPSRSTTNSANAARNCATPTTDKSPAAAAQKYLTNCKSLYSCIHCRTHLANHDELVSRSFQGHQGRAYLFNSVINVYCGAAMERNLNTGNHTVADIFCSNCDTTLGWKYEKAYVLGQRYKEGKYIIELAHVVRENRHLELDKGEEMFLGRGVGHRLSSYSSHSSSSYTSSSSPSTSSSSSSASSSSAKRNNRGSLALASDGAASGQSLAASSFLYEEDNDGDDEELMFPFFDDLWTGGSSYPNSFSQSQHNRMRRSLYLDSTPYDWKHTATAASQDHRFQQPSTCEQMGCEQIEGASLGSSCLSSPTTSSWSSGNYPLQSPYQESGYSSKQNSRSTAHNDMNSEQLAGEQPHSANQRDDTDDEEETQFKFDADKLDSGAVCEPGSSVKQGGSEQSERRQKQFNHHSTSKANDELVITTGANSETSGGSRVNETMMAPTTSSVSGDDVDDDGGCAMDGARQSFESSASLDDEEFYDCYTEHDLTSLASTVCSCVPLKS